MQFLKQVKSKTPESVELEFTLAGVGSRTVALLIDYLIWSIALMVLLFVFGFLFYSVSAIAGATKWVVAIQAFIFFVVYIGYFIFFETIWQGQTPGKRYAKIRVIRDDGRTAGLQQAIMRSLLRMVDDILFLGLLMIMFTKQEKRLGDLVAGTIVVQEGQVVSPKEIAIDPAAQMMVPNLLATGKMQALTPDDFAGIRRYLQRYPYLSPSAQRTVSYKLYQQIIDITKLVDRSANPNHHLFIQTVYLVYQEQQKGQRPS
jgi:uncharacterized RDD family membrane protein YckC